MTTREIDERIANVLRLLAKHWRDGHPAYVLGRVAAELAPKPSPSKPRHPESCRYMGDGDFQCGPNCTVDAWDAAQRAKPASEPQGRRCPKCSDPLIYGDRVGVCGRCSYVESAAAPPLSLVERLRVEADRQRIVSRLAPSAMKTPGTLLEDAADALEAAQADSRRLDALERLARNGQRICGAVRLHIVWAENESIRLVADIHAATMERKPK